MTRLNLDGLSTLILDRLKQLKINKRCILYLFFQIKFLKNTIKLFFLLLVSFLKKLINFFLLLHQHLLMLFLFLNPFQSIVLPYLLRNRWIIVEIGHYRFLPSIGLSDGWVPLINYTLRLLPTIFIKHGIVDIIIIHLNFDVTIWITLTLVLILANDFRLIQHWCNLKFLWIDVVLRNQVGLAL